LTVGLRDLSARRMGVGCSLGKWCTVASRIDT